MRLIFKFPPDFDGELFLDAVSSGDNMSVTFTATLSRRPNETELQMARRLARDISQGRCYIMQGPL